MKQQREICRKRLFEESKNPAPVMLGRLGDLKGGRAKSKELSANERKKIAQVVDRTRRHTENQK